MKPITYPRHSDIRSVIIWASLGDAAFQQPYPERRHLLEGLKNLIYRLDMAPRYDAMRRDSLSAGGGGFRGSRAGQAPVPELRSVLLATLRVHGYVYQSGDHWHTVPLTGRQLHILRGVVRGESRESIARELGIGTPTVTHVLSYTGIAHGCSGVVELVSYIYRSGWFPTDAEVVRLWELMGGDVAPGYLAGVGPTRRGNDK